MTDETAVPENQDTEFEDAFNEFAGDDHAEVQEREEEEPLIEDDSEPETEPEREPSPEPDLKAELERYKQEAQQWQHRYNSDLGRQNAYQRQLQERDQKIAQLEKQMKQGNGQNPQGSGMSDKEWKELQEDFPEIAKAVEARINAVASRYESEISQLKSNLTPIQQRIEAQAREDFKRQQLNILEQQHNDWKEVSQSDDFKNWVNQQPQSIQQLARNSMDAADAAYVLTTYKREKGLGAKPSSDPELKQKRERTLRQAQTIPSRGGRVRGNEPPSDDFDAAFNFFADKVAR